MTTAPFHFPADPAPGTTCLLVEPEGTGLPVVSWVGPAGTAVDAASHAAAAGPRRRVPLVVEHSRGSFARPGIRGHRILESPHDGADRGWSTAFVTSSVGRGTDQLTIRATDDVAGLALTIEVQSLVGGALRLRQAVTNIRSGRFVLDGCEITLPLPDTATEVLDFTGRHERERTPQRHRLTDGLWTRETREGRPGLGDPAGVVAGNPGFSFGTGEVVAVHCAWSGNSVLRVERSAAEITSIGGGELLLPGEITLAEGETYTSPWLVVCSSADGLDGAASQLHSWQRSLPTHTDRQPVNLNLWEAVYFDHGLPRLLQIADLAAMVGVERCVLDDGWFRGRRDGTAGLGDWYVDDDVWPAGLHPLVDKVHDLGMEFGLWFEPEMVNPDSDLYRGHPDWVLSTGGRRPFQRGSRPQLVLDLSNPAAWHYLRDRIDALLTAYRIDAVKWDHNRDLVDAGHGGAPAIHRQTLGLYALLDDLRRRHPHVHWESCASGGGRADLGIIERVERVWTSDMTDALARQQIQRWSVQTLAPEYLGAHVSATTSHQTGRTMSVDFRAATALFGSFGIEWDLTTATEDELAQLRGWIERYHHWRPLLSTGRVARLDSSDPAVLLHGVVAADRASALIAYVQLDESAHNRGVAVRVPGLDPAARYDLRWEGPVDLTARSRSDGLHPDGPTAGRSVTGDDLASTGWWMPRRQPATITLVRLQVRADQDPR